MKLKINIILLFSIIYGVYIYFNTQTKNNRINVELNQRIKELQIHYNLTMNYFLQDAKIIELDITHNKKVIELFSKARNCTLQQRDDLRKQLYNFLLPRYQEMHTKGILQFQFVFPNNISFLRMHKPSKYGDDLTKVRYSFVYVNKTKKSIYGFEQGRTTHAFRYVFPFFDQNNKYLGAVEISLASYSLQDKLLDINKLHSHFLVNKNIFKVNAWKTKDLIVKYIPSMEHKDYMFALTKHYNKQKFIYTKKNIITPILSDIDKNIKTKRAFALHTIYKNNMYIITFLPIKDTQKDIVAYLVSYTKDINIYNIYKDYRYYNIAVFIILLLFAYFIYQILISKKILKNRKKILQKNLDIISKYVIYSKTDSRGIITEVSDAFCEMTKYSREELIGKSHRILKHPDMPQNLYKEMWSTIISGQHWEGEILNKDKNGDPYWIYPTISPEYDENGKLEGYIAIRYNITSKKKLEDEQKKLIQTEKLASMGEMIGNIAHQWRQPLSAISTSATGLQLQKEYGILTDESFNKICNNINDNAQYLSKTIDDFRNFIKNDRKQTIFLLKNTINNFLHLVEANTKSHHINIILNLNNDIKINGYENELIQCLINIFNNAKDILIEKEIKNKIILITTKETKGTIFITIQDNAGGVPQNIIDKIFEPYFTTKHQSQGTGLGLHMTYQLIVDGMSGSIEVNNEMFIHDNIKYIGAKFIISIKSNLIL